MYKVVALKREKRQRIWRGVAETDTYHRRRADMTQRDALDLKAALTVATHEEIMQAFSNLHDKLKPERAFDWNDCTVPKEEFHPSLCAENGMWNEMTGGPCLCTSLCKYHKDYKPLEFAGRKLL